MRAAWSCRTLEHRLGRVYALTPAWEFRRQRFPDHTSADATATSEVGVSRTNDRAIEREESLSVVIPLQACVRGCYEVVATWKVRYRTPVGLRSKYQRGRAAGEIDSQIGKTARTEKGESTCIESEDGLAESKLPALNLERPQ